MKNIKEMEDVQLKSCIYYFVLLQKKVKKREKLLNSFCLCIRQCCIRKAPYWSRRQVAEDPLGETSHAEPSGDLAEPDKKAFV
jgi:hypothetical protein